MMKQRCSLYGSQEAEREIDQEMERTKARLPLPKPQMVEEKAIIAAVTK